MGPKMVDSLVSEKVLESVEMMEYSMGNLTALESVELSADQMESRVH